MLSIDLIIQTSFLDSSIWKKSDRDGDKWGDKDSPRFFSPQLYQLPWSAAAAAKAAEVDGASFSSSFSRSSSLLFSYQFFFPFSVSKFMRRQLQKGTCPVMLQRILRMFFPLCFSFLTIWLNCDFRGTVLAFYMIVISLRAWNSVVWWYSLAWKTA